MEDTANQSHERTVLFQKITNFIEDIGIKIEAQTIDEDTFIPGILVKDGAIFYDTKKLAHPGDLIHEAGHVALIPASERHTANGNIEEDLPMGERLEIGVILWSFAALTHLDMDMEVVFHKDGYNGDSRWHIENFKNKNYVGLPPLQWMGLCRRDDEEGAKFPAVIKWLRD